MDFDFTEEQVMFREEVRRVLKKECPREFVRELDEKTGSPLPETLQRLGIQEK